MKSSSPLVSVIIPTYNRAHLIGETLDSIIAQTYVNWECIVVDDGSTDNTDTVMQRYIEEDTRIQYHHRPEAHLPGGNGARNYGFKKSIGEYIVWFDSDDLMTENHIQVKIEMITSSENDFCITRTKFFNHHNSIMDKFYQFDKYSINLENYILQKINWITMDIIIKRKTAINLFFDENLKCGQEYNYFSKMLIISSNGEFKNEVVTLRRFDENTISQNIRKKSDCKLLSRWFTYLEVSARLSLKTKKDLLIGIYTHVIRIKKIPKEISKIQFVSQITKIFKLRAIFMITYYYVSKVTNRFYFLRKLAFNE
ncbi:glycosyltransferase family 2 protein [Mesonia phycicola]|nr:glycosyltransferase family 2 protein [Mesonia phycicola]